MQEQPVQKIEIEYIPYDHLQSPSVQSISQGVVALGFQSKQWFIQFQTITSLRQANKFFSTVFINQLLPQNIKHIIAQVDNLRSNNSKQALTLLTQIIEHQDIINVAPNVIRPLVSALVVKTVSQKGFLKNQAIKGINQLPKKWNQAALDELCIHTQSANGQISQLAIKIIGLMLQNNKNWQVDSKFLKSLSGNLNGKRAVVQKKARQILKIIKERQGQSQLQEKINSSTDLLEQQSTTLKRQLKQKEQKAKGPSLKQFLKAKKQQL